MNSPNTVLLIGEVVIDVTLRPSATNQMRLGGTLHAGRALWAMNVPYELAFFAPAYLKSAIEEYSTKHGATRVHCLGEVTNSPAVVLVPHAEEAHSQGYEFLLRDTWQIEASSEVAFEPGAEIDSALIFPGKYALDRILATLAPLSIPVDIDWSNTSASIEDLAALGRRLRTIYLSTSSELFLANGSWLAVRDLCLRWADAVVLKENRGGVRLAVGTAEAAVGAQLQLVTHSIGVGDCFDAAYSTLSARFDSLSALRYASHIASHYGCNTYPDDFRRETQRTLKLPPSALQDLPGVRLAWEDRPQHQIYVAAPDFDYLDRSDIELVARTLSYHNFSPRRPVAENGQASSGSEKWQRRAMFEADVALLNACALVVAVTTFDDPGTYVEVGMAVAWGKPVILFDPKRRSKNLMLVESANAIATSASELIYHVFRLLGGRA